MKCGILGDSGIDDYQGSDARGGAYAAYTYGPAELLRLLRGFDLGAWGAYSEPRRTGWAHNWARSGSYVAEIANNGQLSGLVGQVQSGAVEWFVIYSGANDTASYSTELNQVYSGALSGSALATAQNAKANQLLNASDQLLDAGALGGVCRGIPHWTDANYIAAGLSNPTGLQRIYDHIETINGLLVTGLASLGVAYGDVNAFNRSQWTTTNSGQTGIWVGNQWVRMDAVGDEPHFYILSDAHPGTIGCGISANKLILEPLNAMYGLGIKLLTPSELWLAAGVQAGGVFGKVVRS